MVSLWVKIVALVATIKIRLRIQFRRYIERSGTIRSRSGPTHEQYIIEPGALFPPGVPIPLPITGYCSKKERFGRSLPLLNFCNV